MHSLIPHFKYRFATISNKLVACIESDKKVIHEILNLDEFYSVFGYTQEISQTGVLPDEFIWAEYIKGSSADFSSCIQIHIIEYLRKYSDTFQKEYGSQCDSWIAAHNEVMVEKGAACVACRMKLFCGK